MFFRIKSRLLDNFIRRPCTSLTRNLGFSARSRPGPVRAALGAHSARQRLGSKTVEEELSEGTEVLRYLLFYGFGCGYAARERSGSCRTEIADNAVTGLLACN